jgi:hypothetical protein
VRNPAHGVITGAACVLIASMAFARPAHAQETPAEPVLPAASAVKPPVDRAGILRDFAITLAAQQAYRLPRDDVRQHLDGPFWHDYVDSITHLQKGFWDGDEPWTWNLVIHPLMGGVSYHQARTRGASNWEAFLWTAAYSTHFELGVLGQAGLGNNRVSPFDLVFTPLAGALWAVFEEWIERSLLRGGGRQKLLRSLLPAHATANLLRGRAPWRPHTSRDSGRTP